MSQVVQQSGSSIVYLELNGQWYWYDSSSAPLGAGSMGIVYLGYNYYTGAPIAVKMIRTEYASNLQIRNRARSEASMSFLHPNVLRMYGVCEVAPDYGPMYVLSEYVNGFTYERFCKEVLRAMSYAGRLACIVNTLIPVLEALNYIHSLGVIHRDIKPSNIMVNFQGSPKLMDLGIAKFNTISSGMTSTGIFIGTALYAAPELAKGLSIDHKVDIYAAGVMLYEMITGFNPFESSSIDNVLVNQLTMVLPYHQDIPPKLFEIIQRATEKDKNRRYSSALEFAYCLKEFIDSYV